ncbi:MAG: lysophospholipid acyltransferase family protein [Planctomycetota bacterium]
MPRPSQRVAHDVLRFLRKLRVILTVTVYTVLAPFGYALFALAYAVGSRHPLRRIRRMQRITAGAYRILHAWMHWTRIARFDRRKALLDLPPGPCVVVANHPTLIDVTAILATLGEGFTVAKPALYRRRSLRPLLMGAGHIEGPGGDPVAAGRVIEEAANRVRQGFSLVIFPEGTRSVGGRLLPFGRAAFEVACRARVPLVSVAIRCDPAWPSKEVPLLDPPHPVPRLELRTLAIDDPARVDYDSRRLRRMVEGRFQRWLSDGRLPDSLETATLVAAKDGSWPTTSKTA